jgi:hypothetical protein
MALRLAQLEKHSRPTTTSYTGKLRRSRETAVTVWRLLSNYFDNDELDTLAFTLNIPHQTITGDTAPAQAKNLVRYAMRQNRLQELILAAQAERPFLEWPVVPKV